MLPYFSHWHHLSIFLKTDPSLGACSSLLPSNGLACSVLALLVSAHSYVRPESCTLVQGLFLVDTVRTQGSHFPTDHISKLLSARVGFPHWSLQKAQPNPLGSEQRQLPKDIFPLQWIDEFFYFCLELHNRFTFTWIFLCGPEYQEDVLSGTTVKKILKYKIK